MQCFNFTGSVLGLSALERREEFVTKAQQLLPENPDLLQLIQQCLHNLPAKRPLTRELVEKLSSMTAVGRYNHCNRLYP